MDLESKDEKKTIEFSLSTQALKNEEINGNENLHMATFTERLKELREEKN